MHVRWSDPITRTDGPWLHGCCCCHGTSARTAKRTHEYCLCSCAVVHHSRSGLAVHERVDLFLTTVLVPNATHFKLDR